VVSAHLIELGQQALASVTTNVAGGAPLVRCQLLASEFYEALKRELRVTSGEGVVERAMVAAATGLCRHAATASITPDTMLAELRRAIDLLTMLVTRTSPSPSRGRRGFISLIAANISGSAVARCAGPDRGIAAR
jgi:hypothetical protein